MKKIIVFLMSLLLVNAVMAVNVATITDFGDGTVTKDCVAIDSDESIYNAYKNLDSNRDDISIDFDGDKIPPYNPYIKSINDLGTKTEGDKYYGWNFWVTNEANNDFTEPPELAPGWGMGIGDYKISISGEVIGMSYGFTEYNADWTIKTPPIAPAFESYESICEKLVVEEVTTYVDGDKDKLNEGNKIKKVKPESKIKLKVKVKNIHEEEIEIKNIEIKATIKDIEDNEDMEETSDNFDLDASDSNTETIEFDIPLEVDDGEYDLVLEVEGDDNRGIKYSKTYDYSIDIEKEKHDVRIARAELTNPNLKCSRTTSLDINVMNMGTNEEEVVLKVINSELEISKQVNFELTEDPFDEDSKYSTMFTINVGEDAAAGIYPITIRADYGSKTAEKTVELEVSECVKKEDKVVENVDLNQGAGLSDITANVVKTIGDEDNSAVKKKFKINNGIIITAILAYVGIVIGGVYWIIRIMRG